MSRQETTSDFGINWPKSHKRGPYSKSEKESRRNEVCRLHFEYGYSARKRLQSFTIQNQDLEQIRFQ